MKVDIPMDWLLGAGLVYGLWYFYYHCIQHGDRVYIMQGEPQPAIYPPPPIQAPPHDLPFYLPRPPGPGPMNDTCGFPCGLFNPTCNTPPTQCQAYPLCVTGHVVNPMTCQCVPECWVVANAGAVALCPPNSRWNWCVKGCVPMDSMMPDCEPPRCAA